LSIHPGENNYQQATQQQGRQRWRWQAAIQKSSAMMMEEALLYRLLWRSYRHVCPSWSAETMNNVGELQLTVYFCSSSSTSTTSTTPQSTMLFIPTLASVFLNR